MHPSYFLSAFYFVPGYLGGGGGNWAEMSSKSRHNL